MDNIIEVSNLKKIFGNNTVLKNVNLKVKRGETFGLLGPSGAGKTTLIKILTSQLLHTSGNIKILENDITKMKKSSQMRKIGIVTDNSGLYERLTVYDNLALFCELYNVNKNRVDEVLLEVNLSNERNKAINKLSKGMKQRVVLARSILHKPELLFLDEPTSALDPVNRKRIHKVLRKLTDSGTTIFLTTHDMFEAEEICDRVAFFYNGEVNLLDTPRNIRIQYSESSIALLLKDNTKTLVEKDEAGAQVIFNSIQNGELVSIHSIEPTLGDVFVQLTGRDLE